MKKIICLLSFLIITISVYAQENPNAKKVYDTEKAFEKAAAERGVKNAFLEYLADEGIIFRPTAINGKESWQSRPDSPASLTWNPVFVDVSANGAMAYTTGNSVYRPKGKDDPNAYYGEYATIWQRQADGNYKAVLDIGISHDKPTEFITDWKTPAKSNANPENKKSTSIAAAQSFFEMAEAGGLSKAYKSFASEDVRFLRDGAMPILGKKAALDETKKIKDTIKFSKRMFFVSAGDLAYLNDVFTLRKDDQVTAKGNIFQVWKLNDSGVWQIVLDVTNPIPLEKK